MAVVVVKHFKIVAAGAEGGLQKLEVDGGHLRTEDGIVFPHFLRKNDAV